MTTQPQNPKLDEVPEGNCDYEVERFTDDGWITAPEDYHYDLESARERKAYRREKWPTYHWRILKCTTSYEVVK